MQREQHPSWRLATRPDRWLARGAARQRTRPSTSRALMPTRPRPRPSTTSPRPCSPLSLPFLLSSFSCSSSAAPPRSHSLLSYPSTPWTRTYHDRASRHGSEGRLGRERQLRWNAGLTAGVEHEATTTAIPLLAHLLLFHSPLPCFCATLPQAGAAAPQRANLGRHRRTQAARPPTGNDRGAFERTIERMPRGHRLHGFWLLGGLVIFSGEWPWGSLLLITAPEPENLRSFCECPACRPSVGLASNEPACSSVSLELRSFRTRLIFFLSFFAHAIARALLFLFF